MLSIELITLLTESLVASIQNSKIVSERRNIAELENEEQLQEVQHRISEYQARVAQELAIAQRIENAEEVEIEEIYDNFGTGGIGVQSTDGGLNVGIHGNGRKVVKRIYRFKGLNGVTSTVTEAKEE